jgi:hypothetical protein
MITGPVPVSPHDAPKPRTSHQSARALRQGQGQVEEQGALPGLPDGPGAQFALALGGGVRLGRQQLGVHVGGFAAIGWGPAKLGAVGSPALAEQQVIGFVVNLLAGLQAQGPGAG